VFLVTPAKAGVQKRLIFLDFRVLGNDENGPSLTFCEFTTIRLTFYRYGGKISLSCKNLYFSKAKRSIFTYIAVKNHVQLLLLTILKMNSRFYRQGGKFGRHELWIIR